MVALTHTVRVALKNYFGRNWFEDFARGGWSGQRREVERHDAGRRGPEVLDELAAAATEAKSSAQAEARRVWFGRASPPGRKISLK